MRLLSDPRRLALVVVAAVAVGCGSSSDEETAEPGSLAKNASLKGADLAVGSKEFTEQLVLCQITSQALSSAGAKVQEKCGLSGSNSTRAALTSGEIDMYWEYTGTAWTNYLKHTKPITDPEEQYRAVAREDLAENQIRWLERSPGNNTYALVAKGTTADDLGVKTISDYAELAGREPSDATMCVASEFVSRSDGWPGLQKSYGFELPGDDLATMAAGAIYNAVSKGDPCNFGEAGSTDGRIEGLELVVLEDDESFFPIYNPALTVRESILDKHPEVAKVTNPIAAKLTTSELQQLNTRVDIDGEEPASVAQEWLQEQGFTGQ